MVTLYSKEHYQNNEEKFKKERGYIDLEKALSIKLNGIDKEYFTEEHYSIIVNTFANKVIEEFKGEFLEAKRVYEKVRKNSSCLGYTSKIQETQEAHRIISVFEFNCYMLKKFKDKYGV